MSIHEELMIEEQFLDSILNYEILQIKDDVHFWMIRTKKGYFYDEFINNKFIALAWNIIDSKTNFSRLTNESLKDNVLLNYSEIKRPTTVINKCRTFIHEVKEGDYIVIPSARSEYVTFAIAGEYFEENNKTYEIEKEIINRIENNDVLINDVACPYKKRRKIKPLLTVKSCDLNGKLFKAITNYHGISNLDDYWRSILSVIYSSYCYKNNFNLVYHINRREPIGPKKLSQLLISTVDCWCNLVDDEDKISAQINVASPGPVDFSIVDSWPYIMDAANIVAGLTMGVISTVKPDAIPQLIKNLFSLPASISREYIAKEREKLALEKEKEEKDSEVEEKQLNNFLKKIEILEKLKGLGVDPEKISHSAISLTETFNYLEVGTVYNGEIHNISNDNYELDELIDSEELEEETM